MQKTLTVAQMVKLLKTRQGKRTASEFAKELGVSGAYLSDIYKGKREPGGKIVSQFGFRKVTHFVVDVNSEQA